MSSVSFAFNTDSPNIPEFSIPVLSWHSRNRMPGTCIILNCLATSLKKNNKKQVEMNFNIFLLNVARMSFQYAVSISE